MQAGSIVGNIRAKIDELKSGIQQAKAELNGFRGNMEEQNKKLMDVGKKMTMYVTAPIAGIAAMAVKTAAGFEAAMNKVSALSGATGDSLGRLKALAMEMGRETRYSAVEAAEGLSFLAMAGFDVEQSIAALPSVLEMAAAGGMDLAQAADYASNIMTGFGLKAEEMGRVTDVLAATFTSSNTNLSQLAEGMKYVAPIAAGLGMTIEETAAAMGMLGDAGIQGSMAGTTLRQAMMSLMTPTGSAADVINRLKLEVTDAEGEFVGLVDIVRQLEEAGASTQDMMELFGARGAGMIALVSQGSEKFAEFVGELESAEGTGKRISEVMLQGLEGALTILRGSLETLMIVIGERFLPVLTEWVHKGVEIVNAMSNWSSATWNTIAVIAGLVAVIGPMLMIYAKIRMVTLQYAAAKAMATGAVVANTAAQTANNAALSAKVPALAKATAAVSKLGAGFVGLAAYILPVAAVLGVVAVYWSQYLKAMSWDFRSLAEIAEESFNRIVNSHAESGLNQLRIGAETNAEMLSQQLEHYEEMTSLTTAQAAEKARLEQELAAELEYIQQLMLAQQLHQQQAFNDDMSEMAQKTNDELVELAQNRVQEMLTNEERETLERLAEIDERYARMGEIGSEAWQAEIAAERERYAERRAVIAEELGEELKEFEGALAERGLAYNEEAGKIVEIAEKRAKEMQEAWTGKVGDMREDGVALGRATWQGYEEGVEEGHDRVSAAGSGLVDAAGEPLEFFPDEWFGAGEAAADGLGDGLKNRRDYVKDSAKDVVDEGLASAKRAAGISSPSSEGISIGESISEGIARGIQSKIQEIARAAAKVVEEAIAAARRAADSASPSRKAIRIGAEISEGVAIGIEDNAVHISNSITKAMRDVLLQVANPDLPAVNVAAVGGGGSQSAPNQQIVNANYYGIDKDTYAAANDDLVRKMRYKGVRGAIRG